MSRVTRHASRVIFFILLVFSLPALSNIRLPSILKSGMVLQQNSVVNIWGWADPGERVVIEASWLVEKPAVIAGPDRKWRFRIPVGPAGGPHSITLSGENCIVLSDILFGEVWVCSGQSNMEFTINLLGGWKNYKADYKDLKHNDYSAIRLCQITKATSPAPLDTCDATWTPANEHSVAGFSATAFFFARTLYNWLHVPIGLISSNWGGTPAEAWTERSFLEADTMLDYFLQAPNGQINDAGKPSYLYNAMIHPLLNFTIRGVIWYQGESNIQEADLYRKLFTATIGSWRKAWGLGDFPFYFVQIAPYDYGEPYPSAAYLREAQLQSLKVPNTGMAVTIDIGDRYNIHPLNKQDVGLRLGLVALGKTYERNEVVYEGPSFSGMQHEGRTIRLFFNHASEGLTCRGREIGGFTISGADGLFRYAEAHIDGKSVVVSSDSVENPVNVRFAFANDEPAYLFNQAGLPASPFRTDSVPLLVRRVNISFATDSMSLQTTASLSCLDKSCSIRYTRDGTIPTHSSMSYSEPISITDETPVSVRAFKGSVASAVSTSSCFEKHFGLAQKIQFTDAPSPRYLGGKNALLDGIRGSTEPWDGHWMGFHGVDLLAVVDLGQLRNISTISIGFLQHTSSWIFLPVNVRLSVSADGINYHEFEPITTREPRNRAEVFIKDYTWQFKEDLRYIRIGAKNISICPDWHPGKGGKAWIFSDEIIIK